jgi:hypothetical protein
VQTKLRQSAASPQPASVPQASQAGPPQSTSVSWPFVTPSSQAGAWQTPSVHTPLRQSLAPAQPCPAPHAEQLPPQSTSVSSPFGTPSPQHSPGVSQLPAPVGMTTISKLNRPQSLHTQPP